MSTRGKIRNTMAKIRPIETISSMSGKVCSHSKVYFTTNKQTGIVSTGKICYPSDKEPSAAQIAVRQAFAARAKAVANWLSNNKPSSTEPKGTADYQKLLASFKSQNRVGNIVGYANKALFANGTLDISQIGNEQDSGNQGGNTSVKKTLTLIVTPAGAGTVSGAGQYDQGSTANISATPASGYTFARWSDGNTSASRSVVMANDMTLSAVFNSTTLGGNDEGGGNEGGDGSEGDI